MLERSRTSTLALLAALPLMLVSARAVAQVATCTGVAAWNPSTIYNPGDRLVYQGSLYEAAVAIWNAPPDHCPSCGWYRLLGTCGTGGGGQSPTVSITSPANGASLACGATVQISATAADADGSISKVELFDGGFSIATDTSAPYSASWVTTSSGVHQLTAAATDNAGNKTTSSPVSVTVGTCSSGGGGLPSRLLVGYWHNFDNGSGFIKLRDVSPDWDIIDLAFGEPVAGSTSQIAFTPAAQTSAAELQSDVAILHGRGKKVLLSIGGANGHVELKSDAERQQFVDSVTAIVRQYNLDGIDVDFEGQSVHVNPGDSDITQPTTPVIVNLISALRGIRNNIGAGFVLTMAPETFFVQVGYQFYGGTSSGDSRTGAYLPVIYGVRDILTLLHVQDYNSGSVTALDNQFYAMGNADFYVAMTEMLLTGFPVANTGKVFPALRPDQVAIGLPANVNAGNGWTPVAEVQKALNYLIRGQSFGGPYVLRNPGGYRGLRGLMAWSINWDRFAGFDFSRNQRTFLNALPAP